MSVPGKDTPPSGPRVVIACQVMEPELEALRNGSQEVEVRYLDQGLHRTPEQMPEIIQRELDEAAEYASALVLGYGLCSNGIVGLKAPAQGLHVPRAHDCISLLLGDPEAYREAMGERPGTYYLSPGWVAEKKDPLGIMEDEYTLRVGRDKAEWAMKEQLKHYTHIVLINTGASQMAPLRERAKANARYFRMVYEEVRGRRTFLRCLLFGPYQERLFFRFRAGEEITQRPFMDC